jgi:hypothetical protein
MSICTAVERAWPGGMVRTLVGESSDYEPLPPFHDELLAQAGEPRPHAATLLDSLGLIGRLALSNIGRRRDVPPIRGVYRGAAASKVDARVRMHRLNGLS